MKGESTNGELMDSFILTQEGYEKLKEELQMLKSVKRMEVANALEKARAHGDLRENAEYDSAKEAKAQLESRIRTLEEKLMRAKVVDLKDAPTDKVYLGTTVLLKNEKTGDEVKYTFVAENETDVSKGKLAISTPIGKALLGRAVQDLAEIRVPAGTILYRVIKIWRE